MAVDVPDSALRSFYLTLGLTLGAILLVYSLWAGMGWRMLMLGLGWPHVILGFVFYLGVVLRGGLRERASFFILAVVTVAIWILHYRYEIAALIYIYFLYHAFRDDIFVSLWKRARRSRWAQFADAAAVVVILLLLVLLIFAPKKELYRTIRTTELTGAKFSSDRWTLITFDPVADSRGRNFYFHLQAPHTLGLRAFATEATLGNSRSDGEIRVSGEKWTGADDLVFQPYYLGDNGKPVSNQSQPVVPVLLTGGHRVGQTFIAERDNLAGVWLPITRLEDPGDRTAFVFSLTMPLFTYPLTFANLRLISMALLSLILLWRMMFWWRHQSRQALVYLFGLIAILAGVQAIFKTSNLAEYAVLYFSQFVLVFHYFLWYVISFDKLHGKAPRPNSYTNSVYDRVLGYLRRAPHFTVAVILFNVASMAGVFWYHRVNSPPKLLYFFDYKFFLYFLAFHVTFSFKPTFFNPDLFRRISPSEAV